MLPADTNLLPAQAWTTTAQASADPVPTASAPAIVRPSSAPMMLATAVGPTVPTPDETEHLVRAACTLLLPGLRGAAGGAAAPALNEG